MKSVSANHSVNLSGSNQWISIPNSDFGYSNLISITAWAKASEHRTAKLVQKGDWNGFGIGLDLWEGWQASFAMTDLTTIDLNIAQRPQLNRWYHLAATYDGSSARLYIDGQLAKTITVNKTLRQNHRNLSLGCDNGNQKFFAGRIDEISVWTKALTTAEIGQIMTQGVNPQAGLLTAYYPVNEGSGMHTYDVSPNSFDGDLVGATYSTDVTYWNQTDSDGDGVANAWDDNPADNSRAFNNYWPQIGWTTLAFEDLWPSQGDYDFNDLVTDYRFRVVTNGLNKITDIEARFVIRAAGGVYRNGFGFQLSPSIGSSNISAVGASLTAGYISLNNQGLENGQALPTFIVFDDSRSEFPSIAGQVGINTTQGGTWVTPDTITLAINLPQGVYTQPQLNLNSFNPFLIVRGIRGREVHLPDFQPTSLADPTLFGTGSDASQPQNGLYYKTSNNLPWVISVPILFEYPIEQTDILQAHLKLAEWAQSSGQLYPDWFVDDEGYRNQSLIYNP